MAGPLIAGPQATGQVVAAERPAVAAELRRAVPAVEELLAVACRDAAALVVQEVFGPALAVEEPVPALVDRA